MVETLHHEARRELLPVALDINNVTDLLITVELDYTWSDVEVVGSKVQLRWRNFPSCASTCKTSSTAPGYPR